MPKRPFPKKPPRPKSYVLIHDGTYILTCSGGQVASKHGAVVARVGSHIPGGSVLPFEPSDEQVARWRAAKDSFAEKDTNALLELCAANIVKEMKEETGIKMTSETFGAPQWVRSASLEKSDVWVAVSKVESVPDLVNAFERPKITNYTDEPFSALHAQPIRAMGAWTEISRSNTTRIGF